MPLFPWRIPELHMVAIVQRLPSIFEVDPCRQVLDSLPGCACLVPCLRDVTPPDLAINCETEASACSISYMASRNGARGCFKYPACSALYLNHVTHFDVLHTLLLLASLPSIACDVLVIPRFTSINHRDRFKDWMFPLYFCGHFLSFCLLYLAILLKFFILLVNS